MFNIYEMPDRGPSGDHPSPFNYFDAEYGDTTYDQFMAAMNDGRTLRVRNLPADAGEPNAPVFCTTKTFGNDWMRLAFKGVAAIFSFDSATGWSYEKISGDDYIMPTTGIPMADLSDEVKNTLNNAIEIPAPSSEDGGKVLTAYAIGGYGWEEVPTSSGLPEVTSSDNLKILQVRSNDLKPPSYNWEVVQPNFAPASQLLISITVESSTLADATGSTDSLMEEVGDWSKDLVSIGIVSENPDHISWDPEQGIEEPEEYITVGEVTCKTISRSVIQAETLDHSHYEILAVFTYNDTLYHILFTGGSDPITPSMYSITAI